MCQNGFILLLAFGGGGEVGLRLVDRLEFVSGHPSEFGFATDFAGAGYSCVFVRVNCGEGKTVCLCILCVGRLPHGLW